MIIVEEHESWTNPIDGGHTSRTRSEENVTENNKTLYVIPKWHANAQCVTNSIIWVAIDANAVG